MLPKKADSAREGFPADYSGTANGRELQERGGLTQVSSGGGNRNSLDGARQENGKRGQCIKTWGESSPLEKEIRYKQKKNK